MEGIKEIINDSFLREEFIKCIKYKTLNKQYLPKYPVLNDYCYQLWNVDFQYQVFMHILKEYTSRYKELLNVLSELLFQTIISNLDNIEAISYIAEEDKEFENLYQLYGDVFEKDKEDLNSYIKNLKAEIFRSYPDVKGLLLRKLSWFEEDDAEKIAFLKEGLSLCEDRLERKLIYYELLQLLIVNGYVDEIEEFLKKAEEEFPGEELFYEIYGHLGMFHIENEDYKKGVQNLKIFYQWLVYKSLNKEEDTEYLNGNLIVFLTVLGKQLFQEGDFKEASRVFDFAFYMLKNFLPEIHENEPPITRSILEENIHSFLLEYTDFLHISLEKSKKDIFEGLKKEILSSKTLNKDLKEIIKVFFIPETE